MTKLKTTKGLPIRSAYSNRSKTVVSAANYYRRLLAHARDHRTRARAEEAEALRKVRVVMVQAQASEPPTDLGAIARMLDVRSIRTLPLPMHGRIMRDADGITVEISESLHPKDQRFALAHELCHLILDDRAMRESPLGLAQRPASRSLHSIRERLCDVGAAEVLAPTDWLVRDFSDAGEVGVTKAVDAATTADVHVDLIVRRLRGLGLWDGTAVWLRLENGRCFPHKAFPEWDESMLARVSVCPETTTIVAACLSKRASYKGPMSFEILGQPENYLGQCVPTADDEVLALLSSAYAPSR